MGIKASDLRAAYGCCTCHDILDGRAPRPPDFSQEDMLEGFDEGVRKTHLRLKIKEIIS